jgi:hypothetical protein
MEYQLESTVQSGGVIILDHVPFPMGKVVTVTVKAADDDESREPSYALRGTPVQLREPFESVAEADWSVLS